ncbi:hypothetical protein KRP22_011777 [Phytophthora ramorum]|nr:hypothetical protein KRP22_11615 [Phytophthora ramorum]
MTEAALAEHGRGPTVALMTRRRASAPPAQLPTEAVSASTGSASQAKRRSKSTANSENVSGDSNEVKPAAHGAAKAGGSHQPLNQSHPEDACRYPNKRCYNKRAVKNNGELHKFCDMHRDSANRYQRKLEQRLKEKRIQSRMRALQAQQAQAHAQAQAQAQMAHAQAQGHTPFGVGDPPLMGTSNPMLVSPFPGMEVYGGVAAYASSDPMEEVSGLTTPTVPFPDTLAAAVPGVNTSAGLWAQEDEYEPFQHPVQLQIEDLDCLNLLFRES